MDIDRWQQVRRIFGAVLESPGERAALLARECATDDDLRAEVDALLEAHEAAGDFLSASRWDDSDAGSLAGRRIGLYQVSRMLGRGGMGVVYLAFRADREFQRRVALKVLKPGLDSEDVIRRFRTERQILAALEHPNIARLLDGGSTEQGLPYLVMEYVEGQPIDVWVTERRLSMRARLELFRTVCSAVELAHRNLVVHRDLKPSNILVTAAGTPKLLDFGVAKLLNPELSSATLSSTALGLQPMTPDYASPEQVRGEHITTASDVYSLGVLLYELLTGEHPYRSRASSPAEMRRLVTEEDPAKPSLAVAAGPNDLPACRELEGDVDNIVLKALRKEPNRRYASVEQLSEDIRRHLEGLPVSARPGTLRYRASKLVRRHRVGVAAATTMVLAVLGFGAAMGVLAARMADERSRAELERRRAEQVTTFLTEIFEISDPWRSSGETVTAREILDAGAHRLATELADEPLDRANLMETVGSIYQRLGLLDRAEPLLEGALATRRRLLGEEHPQVADALSALARVEEERGRLPEALDLVEQALAIRRRLYGPRHEMVARSLHDLGLLLRSQGDLAAAEGRLRTALALRRSLAEPSPRDIADSLNGLGVVLWERGRYGEAEEVTREALALRRDVLGPDHVEVASTLNLLAVIVLANGDLRQGEMLLREALALRRRLYPGDHPKIAESLNNLGALLKDRGEWDEAETLFGEALAMRRKLFGEEHLSVAMTLENLGWLAFDRGSDPAAARLQRESLAIRSRILGRNHRLVSDSLVALAMVLERQGKLGDAETALREALRIRRSLLGNRHFQVALGLERLAGVLRHRNRPEEAESLAREALEIVRGMQPVVPAYVTEAESVLAACLDARRRQPPR